jgi:hypothetical protein
MADIFEVVIGAAEPALKMFGGLVEGIQTTGKKLLADVVGEAIAPAVADLKSQLAALAPQEAPAKAAPARRAVKRSSFPEPPAAAPAKKRAPAKKAAVQRTPSRLRPLRAPGR